MTIPETGRTTLMVESIDRNQPAKIIVHNQESRDHVRRLVERVHGPSNQTVVCVVRSPADASRVFDGWRGKVAVDHAFWEIAGTAIAAHVREYVERFAARGLYIEAE